MPNAAPVAVNTNDWGDWQQEGEQVDENELHQVQALADNLVQQAVLNQLNEDQFSEVVSSKVLDYYRAHGQPIRLELLLVHDQDRQAIISLFNNSMDIESDQPIYDMAGHLNLHQGYGPIPSMQMLLQDVLQATFQNIPKPYVQRPVALGLTPFLNLQRLQGLSCFSLVLKA